jgi:acyl carrier protein
MTDSNLKKEKKLKLLNTFFKKEINVKEDLFTNGYLDSLKVIDLIIFIEKKTKKKISPKKVQQKSFSNINNILKIF